MKPESTAPDTAILTEFIFRLGQAYLACGEQTAKVALILRPRHAGRRRSLQVALREDRVVAFADRAGWVLSMAREEKLNGRRLDGLPCLKASLV
jgi:hypothetical protein